jgi:N-acetyl-anhydromuramoyl-L-alanine amidase
MPIDAASGWLNKTKHLHSPNFNSRPEGTDISLLVIHNISLPPGIFGGDYIDKLFTNGISSTDPSEVQAHAFAPVSAHVLIDRQGQLTQYVSFLDRAWHAGESTFEGVPNCNDYAIGIELEGTDDIPYATIQYKKLAHLAFLLCQHYPTLGTERIVGHNHIAPLRKTDPGPVFDWSYFRTLFKRLENNAP